MRKVDGSGTIDLGDISVMKRRLEPGDTEGDLGVHWVEQLFGTPPDQQRFEVCGPDESLPFAVRADEPDHARMAGIGKDGRCAPFTAETLGEEMSPGAVHRLFHHELDRLR